MKLTLEITQPDKAEFVLQFLQQLDFVRVTSSTETPTFSHERLYLVCKRMAETNPFRVGFDSAGQGTGYDNHDRN